MTGRGLRRPRQASGRSLIELVMALAIGALMLAGFGASYLSARGVARVAQQVGTAEHTARLALVAIGEAVKAAGYGEIVGSDHAAKGQTLFQGPALRGCTASRFADAFSASNPDYTCTGNAPGDQVLVRFQGRYALVPMDAAQLAASALPDCLGASNSAQDAAVAPGLQRAGAGLLRRVVQSAFFLDPSGSVLRCHGNGNPGTPAPIANDVIDFRVFYRFDDAGFALARDGHSHVAPIGASLRDAAWINTAAGPGPVDPWQHVVAVVVCLTVASRESGTSLQRPGAAAARCPRDTAEAALGTTIDDGSSDGRLRRTLVETFTVRSQATAAPSLGI